MPESNPLLDLIDYYDESQKSLKQSSLGGLFEEEELYQDNPLLALLSTDPEELTPTGLPSLRRQRIPEYDVQPHVGAAERFGKRFAEAFVPFTWYEPDLPDPEGFGETLTGAIGSVFGFLAGSIPFALATGGASVPLTAIDKTSKIYKGLNTALKVGGKSAWTKNARKIMEQPSNKMFLIRGKSGFIGGNKAYVNMLKNIAAKGPTHVKMARALDAAQRNFVPFAMYGQTHMKMNSPLEQRFSQLGHDTLMAGAFTALGLPSTVIWANTTGLAKGGIIAAESAALFGMGAFSDGGTTDIPVEERLAHGLILSTMHGVMRGLNREGSKRQLIEEFRRQGYSEEEAIRLAFELNTGNTIVDVAKNLVESDKNLFVGRDYFQKGVRGRPKKKELGDYLVRFDPKTMVVRPKKGRPYIIYEKLYAEPTKDGYVEKSMRQERIEGKSINEALRKFNNKFISIKKAKTEVEARVPIPEGPTEEQLAIRKVHSKYERALDRATAPGARRKAEVIQEPTVVGEKKVKSPKYITVEESMRKEIDGNKKAILNIKKRLKRGTVRIAKPMPRLVKDKLERNINDLNERNIEIEKEISEMFPARLSEPVRVEGLSYETGDYVRIPLYEGEGNFSTSEAGIGRYVGTYDEVILGKKLKPQQINTEATGDLTNADVFEVTRVKGPEKVEYVTLNRVGAEKKRTVYRAGVVSKEMGIDDLPIDAKFNKSVSQRYGDMGVSTGSPFKVKLTYKKQYGTKWVSFIAPHIMDPYHKTGFSTKAEAEAWADAHWRGSEGLKSIEEAKRMQHEVVHNMSGSPEYQDWTASLKDIKKIMKKTTDVGSVQKELIKLYFPDNTTGDINLLNSMEIKELRSRFEAQKGFDFLPEDTDTVIPSSVMSEGMGPIARRILTKTTGAFPIHTILEWMGPAGTWISRRMIRGSQVYRVMMGATQEVEKRIKKLIGSKDWHNLAIHMDEKYVALRSGKSYQNWLEKNSGKHTVEELPDGTKYTVTNVEQASKLLRDYFDSMFIAQSQAGYLIKNARSRKLEPVLRVQYNKKRIIDEGGKTIITEEGKGDIPIGKIMERKKGSGIIEEIKSLEDERDFSPEDQIMGIIKGEFGDLVSGDKNKAVVYTREYVPKVKGERLVEYTIEKVKNNSYNENYFPRMITDDFFKALYKNTSLKDAVLHDIIESSPEIEAKLRTGQISLREAMDLALNEVKDLEGLFKNNKVFGQMWTRIANLPTHMFFNKLPNGGLKRIKVDRVINEKGDVYKVGDTVAGKKIDKVLQVYDLDFPEIMRKYSERTSRSTAAYYSFEGVEGLTKGPLVRKLDELYKESGGGEVGDFYKRYAKRVVKEMVMGQDISERGPVAKMMSGAVSKVTRASASIGLSFPISGFKNILLGQVQLATHFQIRDLLKTYWDLSTGDWAQAKHFATKIGARYTGVYDLYLSSNPILRMIRAPGLMQPTEMANRIVSSAMAHRTLEIHLDNLAGKGDKLLAPRRTTSRHILMDVFKFSPKEVANMVERRGGGSRGYGEKELHRAADMAHTITQGVGDYPYVPLWMGKDWARPMTLFYRIAYRMTNNIVNNVMKPATRDGNIFPMMKYVGLSMGAGSALYSTYYYLFDEERKNQFKDAPAGYWSNLIRAEGLGIISNAFDEYGEGFVDVYTPVVFRNMTDVYREAMNIAEGKKGPWDGVKDLSKRTVSLIGGTMRIVENATADTRKRYKDSKRRQRQFTDAYFKDWNPPIDSNDALTKRTPFYRHIRDLFWYEDNEEKAKAYYSALAYITHQLQRERTALALDDRLAERKAKGILKSIISKQRPIASSWRGRERGERTTKYNLYLSKLNDEDYKEEVNLDRLYRTKKQDFWRAINQYRSKYYWR